MTRPTRPVPPGLLCTASDPFSAQTSLDFLALPGTLILKSGPNKAGMSYNLISLLATVLCKQCVIIILLKYETFYKCKNGEHSITCVNSQLHISDLHV